MRNHYGYAQVLRKRPRQRLILCSVFFFLDFLLGADRLFGQEISTSVKKLYYISKIGDTVVGEEIVSFHQANAKQWMINSFSRYPYGLAHRCVDRLLILEGPANAIKEYRRTEQVNDVNFPTQLYEWDKRWWWVASALPFLPYYTTNLDLTSVVGVFESESVALLQHLVNTYEIRGRGTQVHACVWDGAITEVTIQQEPSPADKLWLRVEGPQKISLDLAPENYMIKQVTIENNPLIISNVKQLEPMTVQTTTPLPSGINRNQIDYTAQDGAKMTGELYLPILEGPFPTIVMIGEGAYGAKMGGLFESIALELVTGSQVAFLLLNQRGLSGSEGTYGEHSIENLVADTENAINYLKQTREIDSARIVVAGYGLGGYVAMAVAARNPLLRGCIFMASPAEPYLPDLAVLRQKELAQQEGWTEEKLSTSIQRVRDQVDLISKISGNWVKLGGKPYSLHFSRSCLEFAPLQNLRSIFMPVLVMHGTSDRSVPKSQAEILVKTLIESGNNNVTLELLPRLDHWLGKQSAIANSFPAPMSIKVDPAVTKALAQWITKYIRS